ncbi:unnamed protein product, partial [Polarella glacialis]
MELNGLVQWIRQCSKSSAPWVARVKVNAPGLPRGTWEVLSSESFLTVPLQWSVVLSAGTLTPKVLNVNIHTMSMQHDGDARKSLWEEFELLLPYVLDAEVPGATIAWVPDTGRPVIFEKSRQKWTARLLSYMQHNVLMFLMACAFNLTAAFGLSGFTLWWSRANLHQRGMQILREGCISSAASHRIGKTFGSSHSWRVMATLVDQPDQGVVLRWRKRTGVTRSAYFWIYAVAEQDPSRGLPADEVIIERVPAEQAATTSENSIIIEFLFSVSGDKGFGYEPTGRNLQAQHRYRFKVLGYNTEEELVGESEWSNEIYIQPKTTVFDLPFQMLKAYFPVPTCSLQYFIDHYARFNIQGRIPQHLVILSDIRICYHKNFGDFKDCGSRFLLSAYMGDSRGSCESQTRNGRCTTFSATGSFTPPSSFKSGEVELDEDNEDIRTQHLDEVIGVPTTLTFGSVDRKLSGAVLSLRKWSLEDAAECKLDWEDLMEAFEETDKDRPQTFFVDLKTETEQEFDEDYLCWVEARVTFTNNIDPLCREMPKEERLFVKDAPGQIFYEGMERFISWDAGNDLLGDVQKFDIYIVFPDKSLEPRKLVTDVATSSGGVSIMMNFPIEIGENYAVCQIEIDAFSADGVHTFVLGKTGIRSHRFVICRTWTVADFEIQYASFCKMNNMDMERVTDEELSKFNMTVSKEALKVVQNLRAPLPFETNINPEREVIDTPGLFRIGSEAVVAMNAKLVGSEFADVGHGSDAGSMIHSTSKNTIGSGGGRGRSTAASVAGSGGGRGGEREDFSNRIYRPASLTVGIVENAWPKRQPWFNLEYGAGWLPSFLLLNSFYPVDNIMNGMAFVVNLLNLNVGFQALQAVAGFRRADTILAFLTAPITFLVPYLCEAALFIWQVVFFLIFPTLLLIAGLAFEFVGNHLSANWEREDETISSHMPDIMFSQSVSGRDLEDWLMQLPRVSKVCLFGGFGSAAVFLLLIFRSNFLKNFPPWQIQYSVNNFLDSIGNIAVTVYVLATLTFAFSCALWFAMVVVIYPESMLTALAVVGGIAAVFYTMFTSYRTSREQLEVVLREEIPEVLELVCETFLDYYERTLAGKSRRIQMENQKLDGKVVGLISRYAQNRLQHRQALAEVWATDDPKEIMSCLFSRALVKERNWATITRSERGGDAEVETTDEVLEGLGLPQEDTAVMPPLDLRMRLADRELEAGGENIHNYNKDLREKVMRVFVRMQDMHGTTPPDVEHALGKTKLLAHAMYRSNIAKLKFLSSQQGSSDSRSLLQLFIREHNQQKLKKMLYYLAEYLDEQLDNVTISEKLTPFVETIIPAEIKKQLRLTLDQHFVGSSMQQLFEDLRRWKGATTEQKQEACLELCNLKSSSTNDSETSGGLMKLLQDFGIIGENMSKSNRISFYRKLERTVRQWKREEAGFKLVIDAADLEEFVRDLVDGNIWWNALKSLLINIGFPMAQTGQGDAQNLLTEEQVRQEFEAMSLKEGLLPKEKVLDFLRAVTKSDVADGMAGRLWKAEMKMLMRNLGICGWTDMRRVDVTRSAEDAEDSFATIDSLPELAKCEWPAWLEAIWVEMAPVVSDGSVARPFLPKTSIYAFLKKVVFAADVRKKEATQEGPSVQGSPIGKLDIIDEEYDNWLTESVPGSSSSSPSQVR